MTMTNQVLISQVLDAITVENLDMGSWGKAKDPKASCGTTMCFAGHAAVIAGHELEWEERQGYDYEGNPTTYYVADYTKEGRLIETVAKDELNISKDQATAIFFATGLGNNVERLRELVTDVTDNPEFVGSREHGEKYGHLYESAYFDFDFPDYQSEWVDDEDFDDED
jgi:hypothetical protein